MTIRHGKIGYLNVLPIYHPLEAGIIPHDMEIVSGPPADLNDLMDQGRLDLSANSCMEYARHPDKYYLIPDLAIGSRGPVQSVLLLSRYPVEELDGRTILVSAQTHTSAALLQVLEKSFWQVRPEHVVGNATAVLEKGELPEAILAIGDEALNLRHHPEYHHRIDLGEAWRLETGLPFIFGVWLVSRESWKTKSEELKVCADKLLQGKRWGQANIDTVCGLVADHCCLNFEELQSYFAGLVYDMGEMEMEGMRIFCRHLHRVGLIDRIPEFDFLPE